MKLKNNIKLMIIQRGYNSVQEFSKENDLSYYMVRKLSKNETNSIDIKLLVKLCKAFNCEVGDLFYIERSA